MDRDITILRPGVEDLACDFIFLTWQYVVDHLDAIPEDVIPDEPFDP